MAMIHELIGKAMPEIGAIGKDSRNTQQGFQYRGIDAVYNALNPIMAKYGLFICPEVLDQKREERTTKNGNALIYTILTMKYSIYAPDGSNVSCTVVGEGMDSGDKSANKAMSVAMKYAMFQLFFIPTEDLRDPDAECHEVVPKNENPPANNPPANVPQEKEFTRPEPAKSVKVENKPTNPVYEFIDNEQKFMAERFGITPQQMKFKFREMRNSLIEAKIIPDIPAEKLTRKDAQIMVEAMYKNFMSDNAGEGK